MTDLAAALLRDVRRFSLIDGPYGAFMGCATSGDYLHVSDVSLALSRAFDPALAERVGVPADVRDYAIDVSEAFDTLVEVERNPAGAWQAIQALAGHIAALPARGVGVRKLEWEESVKGRWIGTPVAKLGDLAFWIFQVDGGFRLAAKDGWQYHLTLEAAKAAAQADYEARIRAALETKGKPNE